MCNCRSNFGKYALKRALQVSDMHINYTQVSPMSGEHILISEKFLQMKGRDYHVEGNIYKSVPLGGKSLRI